MEAATCRAFGAVPLAGEIVSHAASGAALKESVPPPVFEIVTALAAGLPPPCCAVNIRFVGLTESAAVGAFTVTGALADLLAFATLVAFTVIVWSVVTVGAVNKPALLIVPPVADQNH